MSIKRTLAAGMLGFASLFYPSLAQEVFAQDKTQFCIGGYGESTRLVIDEFENHYLGSPSTINGQLTLQNGQTFQLDNAEVEVSSAESYTFYVEEGDAFVSVDIVGFIDEDTVYFGSGEVTISAGLSHKPSADPYDSLEVLPLDIIYPGDDASREACLSGEW